MVPGASRPARRRDGAVDRNLVELYRSSLRDFVRGRDAIAARLAKSGRTDDAKAVRALVKPKASVWGLNRVAREAPKLVRRVLKAFDDLKQAQLRKPEHFGAASEELRAAVDAAVDHAASVLTAEGMSVSLETRRRMDATLRGAAAQSRDALTHGTLTEDLPAPGFELFAGAQPRGRGPRPVRAERPAKPAPPDRAELLRRRAAQLEEEAAGREREATAAASALLTQRRQLRELEERARAAQRAAARSRRTATRARGHADRRARTRAT